jgi:hypothetical protein
MKKEQDPQRDSPLKVLEDDLDDLCMKCPMLLCMWGFRLLEN